MSPPREALPPGTVLDGRYELASRIADGPTAEVYAGRDRVLERSVTVKVHRGSPEARARFERDVHELAGKDGPSADRVFDAGTDGDLAYAVLEPRETEDLDEDLTQPIATDHTAELPVPPMLLPEPEPVVPVPGWSGRATRNVAIAAACLVGLGALVLAAEGGPGAVETPSAPTSTVTTQPSTTIVAVTEAPTAITLFPPGFPFEDGGPRGKDKKG